MIMHAAHRNQNPHTQTGQNTSSSVEITSHAAPTSIYYILPYPNNAHKHA